MSSYTSISERAYISLLADDDIRAARMRLSSYDEINDLIYPLRSGTVTHYVPGLTPATGPVSYLCDWYFEVASARMKRRSSKTGTVSVTPSPSPDFRK